MTISVSFHGIERISLSRVYCSRRFYWRELKILCDNGETMNIPLHADEERFLHLDEVEKLNEPIEVKPDTEEGWK
jgi:hypothetical protein